jgi:hypothetical protein
MCFNLTLIQLHCEFIDPEVEAFKMCINGQNEIPKLNSQIVPFCTIQSIFIQLGESGNEMTFRGLTIGQDLLGSEWIKRDDSNMVKS